MTVSSDDRLERVFVRLVDEDETRACADIPPGACQEEPRAFILQLVTQALGKIADALVSPRIVLAWMLGSLGTPAALIAMLVPVRESLSLIPQLFIAPVLRRRAVRKRFWVAGSLCQAGALAGMLIALLFLSGTAVGVAVLLLLALFSLSRGVCSIAAKDVLGKTVAKSRRGQLVGIATTVSGVVTIGVAGFLWLSPMGSAAMDRDILALLLVAGVGLWILAAFVYSLIPEQAGATEGGASAWHAAVDSLRQLSADPAFGKFVLTRVMLLTTAFAVPFVVMAIQRTGALDSLAPLLLTEGLAGAVSGVAWGRWSDRAATRVMGAAALLSVAALLFLVLLLMFAEVGLYAAIAALFLTSLAHSGVRVARKTYLVDLTNQDNRAQYTAVANCVVGVALLLFGLVGVVDSLFGIVTALWVLLAGALLGALLTLRLPAVSH